MLTLEQVLATPERFAWHEGGATIDPQPPGSYIGPPVIPTTGWHHLPGCDCEFCHDA